MDNLPSFGEKHGGDLGCADINANGELFVGSGHSLLEMQVARAPFFQQCLVMLGGTAHVEADENGRFDSGFKQQASRFCYEAVPEESTDHGGGRSDAPGVAIQFQRS